MSILNALMNHKRQMDTRRSEFVRRNERKLCDAKCGRLRYHTHAHCRPCRTAITRHGHPMGRKIPRSDLEPREREVRKILDRFPDHPGVVGALGFTEYINAHNRNPKPFIWTVSATRGIRVAEAFVWVSGNQYSSRIK